eukprot:1922935-Alexandrium_andersonii.AAC.1
MWQVDHCQSAWGGGRAGAAKALRRASSERHVGPPRTQRARAERPQRGCRPVRDPLNHLAGPHEDRP